jgi:hypothetical protein
MPESWKKQAKAIGRALRKKGIADKKAERIGYATATKQYIKKHKRTPQSDET